MMLEFCTNTVRRVPWPRARALITVPDEISMRNWTFFSRFAHSSCVQGGMPSQSRVGQGSGSPSGASAFQKAAAFWLDRCFAFRQDSPTGVQENRLFQRPKKLSGRGKQEQSAGKQTLSWAQEAGIRMRIHTNLGTSRHSLQNPF